MGIANPATGCQKVLEIEDERKLREFYDKRMNQEVIGDVLGDEFKGYIFKISGGNDKQGFPMKQGVMTSKRVRLLLKKGSSCYRQRRKGERKRKSVRGCIVSGDIQVLNLVIVRKGEGDREPRGGQEVPRPRRQEEQGGQEGPRGAGLEEAVAELGDQVGRIRGQDGQEVDARRFVSRRLDKQLRFLYAAWPLRIMCLTHGQPVGGD